MRAGLDSQTPRITDDVGAILGLSLPILAHLRLPFKRSQSPKKGQWPAERQCQVN